MTRAKAQKIYQNLVHLKLYIKKNMMTEIRKRFFNELVETILSNIENGNLSEIKVLLKHGLHFAEAGQVADDRKISS